MIKKRCGWVGESNPLMLECHDREGGVLVHDDGRPFEFLVLQGAQAGLNWSIILNKREGYRRAFSGFDPNKVARYAERRVQKLVLDSGIIRNRQKIQSAVRWRVMKQIPATSAESDAFSKDLKRRGFSFVGPPIIYAHMQAVGMVHDHLVDCFRYREVATA